MQRFISPDVIRDRFSKAMSQMYQREVPQYGTLLQIVQRVNGAYLQQYPATFSADEREEELNRLNVERHGAIRLGTAQELSTMRQLFAVMGMQPVSYYDLSAAGVPVHSTAFRATDEASLRFNPFRVFTSLLRLELIADDRLRQRAESILNQRDIFTSRARELIAHCQQQGGLIDTEANEFVREALETFRWHREAQVDFATYNALSEQHRLVADVVCFKGPHINHLTPRTLNIDAVQAAMPEYQITPKESIEGPPRRQVPILLRQTSFKALSEQIVFSDHAEGKHTARFGEIEQRGMALTPAGRALYDRLLQQNDAAAFTQFPDDETTLRQQKLGYFRYALAAGQPLPATQNSRQHLEALLAAGVITATPIIYEDFLPVSAAGIFQSNLDSERSGVSQGSPNKAAFEAALGCQVTDEFSLYQALEEASLQRVFGEV